MDETADQRWIQERIKAVSEKYDVYDALSENGVEIGDRDSTVQIPCPLPGHGPDNRPSARYYAASGRDPAHFYCFKCKARCSGIDLFGKLKNIGFMQALSELERRFGIKVQRRPETSIPLPADKRGSYTSEAWTDVPRFLDILESKLLRVRDSVPMVDFVKWCRVVDSVRWDMDRGATPAQVIPVLFKVKDLIDETKKLYDCLRIQD